MRKIIFLGTPILFLPSNEVWNGDGGGEFSWQF